MSILETIMGQMGGSTGQMIEQQVAGMIAQKMGIDPAMAQSAIAALTQAHTAPTDTVTTAAQQTGMSPDILSQIVSHIGGEGALGSLVGQMGAQSAGGVSEDGGSIGGALSGMLGGLMGGNKS